MASRPEDSPPAVELTVTSTLDPARRMGLLASGLVRLRSSSLVGQIVATMSTRLTTLFISMALGVVVARVLGPQGRGEYALAGAVLALAAQLCNLGLHASNTYHLSKDHSLLERLTANSLVVSIGVGTFASAVVVTVRLAAPQALRLSWPILAVVALAVPLSVAFLLVQNLLLALQDVRGFNGAEIVRQVLVALLTACVLALGLITPTWVVTASAVGTGLGLAWMWRRMFPRLGRLETHWLTFRAAWSYGWRAYVTALAAYVVLRVDVLLVSSLAGLRETGLYSVAVAMVDLLYLLPVATGSILFPRLTQTPDPHERWLLARRYTVGITFLMMALLAVGAALAQPGIVLLYGSAYKGAASPFLVLLPGLLFLAANTVLNNYFASIGMPLITVIAPIVAGLVNIGANFLLIPAIGIVGAALASTIAYGLMLAFSLGYLAYRPDLRPAPL